MLDFRKARLAALLCFCWLVTPLTLMAQGVLLPAGGAVNRGMGGATTGTAIEAIGSMYWNPATISRLPTNELAFGFEAIYGNTKFSSTFPAVGTGSSEGEPGVISIPTIAWVHHMENSNMTIGLGIFAVGGFAANVRGDATNPIVSPPFALGGAGVGGFKSDAIFLEFNPTVSVKVTDRLSIGGGPIIGLGKITLDDNIFVAPNADGLYPRGDGTRYHWGLGAQLGFHYVHNCCWEFGGNIKTPVWFESFRYFGEDATGLGRTDKVDVTLPMVVSGGIAYRGFEWIVLTADLRYFDYSSTDGFGDRAGYAADGSVTGLGWKDVFSLGLGAQIQLTDRLVGRIGYIYASDLIDDDTTFFNIAADLSYRHIPTIGATYQLSESASLSFAYNYVFEWGSTGPYVLPGVGAVPGSRIRTERDVHILTMGINVRY